MFRSGSSFLVRQRTFRTNLIIKLGGRVSLCVKVCMYVPVDVCVCVCWLWISLNIRPYRPSLLAGPVDVIQCPHIADACKSLMVGQHWHVHKESIRERRL